MLSTIDSGLKTEATRLGKGLTIYKQPKAAGRGSPYWYARANVHVGGRKVHTKSTKTSDRKLAEDRAQEFLSELLAFRHVGVPMANGKLSDRAFRFDLISDEWLDSLLKSAGGDPRKFRRYHDHRKILGAPNGLLAFFGKSDVRTITTKKIEAYLDFACAQSRKGELAPTTRKNHLATMSKLMGFAVDLGRIERAPRLPTVRSKNAPRATFTANEYRKLNLVCWSFERFLARTGDHEQLKKWQELRDFIVFMVNSFLRPSEWAGLRVKDVEVVLGDLPHLKIAVAGGKTGPRVALTMPGAIRAFERILKRRGADQEQYLFMPQYPNRATAKERMGDWFATLLEQAGLTFDPLGRKRTIYSLRHTALMLRVLNGDNVDLLALARNAGTSVKMLDQFYCSHLQAEQKLANLQSFKVKPLAERARESSPSNHELRGS